jgi:hypothetical protein
MAVEESLSRHGVSTLIFFLKVT